MRAWTACPFDSDGVGLPSLAVRAACRATGQPVPRPVSCPATFLLAKGMGLEDVKNQLGHSSIALTSNKYGHVPEQRQREVARAMDAVLGG
jgi:integrase